MRLATLGAATGAMGRPASFKGEGEYLGKGVSYCATCDGAFYVGEEVVVSGVNGEAVEEALYLTKFAKVIHWITNSEPNMEVRNGNEMISWRGRELLGCVWCFFESNDYFDGTGSSHENSTR